jgi:hypothetical protein
MPQVDLAGAQVSANDTFQWHLAGGAELTVKKRWSLFVDLRWIDASRSFSVAFNNSDELGNSLPNYQPFDDDPLANARYGPNQVGLCTVDPDGDLAGQPITCTGGGLVDFGYVELLPSGPNADSTTDCQNNASDITDATRCEANFVFVPDGVPDPGLSYAQGGTFGYDGFQGQFGVRFTFGK